MPIIRCPQCQEKMQVDRGDLDERVVCPRCDHRFAAREDSLAEGGEDRPTDRGRARSRPADDFDRPRRKPKSSRALWITLGIVGALVFLVCGGCIGFAVYVNTAKESFAGSWTDQSVASVDGGVAPVSASFPMLPVSSTLGDSANGGAGTELAFNNMDQNGSMKDAIFLIGYVDYPAGTMNPLEKGYLPIRTALTETHLYNPLMSPRITGESPTTLYGYPAKEAKYSEDDGGFVLRVIHVNDRPRNSPARLVVILTGGTGTKDADKQKFLDSVKIGKGK